MKTHYLVLFIVCCTLSACDRHSDNSRTAASDSATSQAWKDYNEQTKRAGEQLQAQADMLKHADALLIMQEQMIKRQQDDFAKFEKILDTWESQQKQYQKYLDSLPK
jgi:hypothetical protein